MLPERPPDKQQVEQAEPSRHQVEIHPLIGMRSHESGQQRPDETSGAVAGVDQPQPAMRALEARHEDVCLGVLVSLAQGGEDEGHCEQAKRGRLPILAVYTG